MKTSLDKLKEEMTDKVIAHLSEIRYMTDSERKAYLSELKGKMKEKMLVTTVRTQSGRTNAYDYNQTAFELYLDILTTFSYVNKLYDTINTHQKLNESIVNTLYSTIATLNDRLDECESVIGTSGSPECHLEGFRTQNNQEWDKKYYTERYGEQMPLATYAKFNSEQENITLNYTRQQNVMVYKSGVQLGEISIEKQYGAGFITARNSQTKLENAIDTSPASYWAETILCDTELKVIGQGFEAQEGLGKYNRSYYDLPRGALCEICLTFEALAKVNEIVMNPFGSFPIDVIAIRYQLSDDDDDDTYDVVAPENSVRDWLISKSLDKEYAFHFPEITCKKLFILINQLHCIKDSYMISSNQMFKNELWFNATYDETADVKMDDTTVFAPLYLDRALDDAVWTYINNKIVTNKHIDVNDILITNKNRMLPVTKYQYTYGFYNIAPNFVEFQMAGVWVSQEIDVGAPIDTIRLTSDEEHYKATNNLISTDIEFYITTKKNPSYTDWHPICPKNKDYVYKERMQLDYDYCYLRHKAVCGNIVTQDADGNWVPTMERPIVYLNDIVLTEDADYILRYDDDGNVYAVEVSNIDHFALYTVSYTPIDASKELALVDDGNPIPNNSYEEINGNGTACYELEGFPYYSRQDPSSTMSYVKIIDTGTGKVTNQTSQSTSMIECVTDKDNPANSYKNFVANTNKIQYYTYGKHVYFNRPIKTGQKIEINYPSLDSKVRVKVILRRNTKHDLWITPVLKSYQLEFTTL